MSANKLRGYNKCITMATRTDESRVQKNHRENYRLENMDNYLYNNKLTITAVYRSPPSYAETEFVIVLRTVHL